MSWIELEGAVNVRDLGGLATEDGGKTVDARLLRADNLQELSPADVEQLVRGIGLTTVVDLRSSAELASEAIIARLRRSPTYASDLERKPADSHRPRAETMAAFLEQLDARYGGATAWLAAHGLSDQDLHLLRARLRDP
jgi:hypothetical protein